MKRICTGILALLMLGLAACSITMDDPATTRAITEPPANTGAAATPQGLLLLDESGANPEQYDRYTVNHWLETIGGSDFYTRGTYDAAEEMIPSTYFLRDRATGKETPVDFPKWYYGEGSHVVLQDRYYFEWLSGDEIMLLRVDGATGEVKILVSAPENGAMGSLSRLDDSHFTSFTIEIEEEADGTETEYSVVSVYDTEGSSWEIIREACRIEAGAARGTGRRFESVIVVEGKIYAFGREYTGEEGTCYLYTYDAEGKPESSEALPGLHEAIGRYTVTQLAVAEAYIQIAQSQISEYAIVRRGERAGDFFWRSADNRGMLLFSDSLTDAGDAEYFFIAEGMFNDEPLAFPPLKALPLVGGGIATLPLQPNEAYPYLAHLSLASNGDLILQYEAGDDPENPQYGKRVLYALPKAMLLQMLGGAAGA